MSQEFAIFLNGGYGAGKTTTLDHLGDLLADAGVAFALVDVDWLHRSWPVADSDPSNTMVEAQNLSAVWSNYRRTGPRQLVVSGVIASESDRRRYERAAGMVVRSVLLRAGASEVERRLTARYPDRPAALSWHLERHVALSRQIESAAGDELVIETDGRSPREVARAIVAHFS